MESDELAAMGDPAEQYNADLRRLLATSRGRKAREVEHLVQRFADRHSPHMRAVDVALLARVLADKRWLWKHPIAAVALAWRHRTSNAPHQTLLSLARPRFAG